MSIGNAIVNQALGAANKSMMGGLKKVLGNLPGSGLGSGTVAGIKNPGGGSINLSYPLDVEQADAQGHYIMFLINTADPATVKKAKEDADKNRPGPPNNVLGEDLQTGGPGGVDARKVGGGQPRHLSGPKQSLTIAKPATVRIARAISLYMPPSIKSTYHTDYTDQPMGAMTTSLNELFNNAMNTFDPSKTFYGAEDITGAGAGQAASETVGGMGLTFAKAAAGAMSLFGAEGAAGAIEIQMGKILAQKQELLFTGVGRRTFAFSFNFIPKSEKEAQMVYEIVHTFKRHMMPAFSSLSTSVGGTKVGTSAQGRILTIPDSFDIQYMFHGGENPWINKISTCYLKSMEVQYGAGDKQTFYEPLTNNISGKTGRPPQTTTISMTFEEIEKMSRERMEEGF